MDKDAMIDSAVAAFDEQAVLFERFRRGIVDYFSLSKRLNQLPVPILHSIKSRMKDLTHLREKIRRKWDDSDPIDSSNVFRRVTDLCGVRLLHLHQEQFPAIHDEIMLQIKSDDWVLGEAPVAYSWDPESAAFFRKMGINVLVKESYYTSIHYLLKPRRDAVVCCEVQVRTLFEEIWGEIDHAINYPENTSVKTCSDQLKVLARLVSTGTKLADAIFSAHSGNANDELAANIPRSPSGPET